VSLSNLSYFLDTAKDTGEDLPEDKAIIRKSGYLLFNLINLHPFLDGNKRTAFEVTKNFLRLNGCALAPEEDDAFDTLVSISKGEMDAESTDKVGSKEFKERRGAKVRWQSRSRLGARRR
jgi:death-on-curing family protein